MKEDLIIYESLRNEIIRLQEAITNETIYMYVTYFALLAFGYKYEWMILASFIVLIVFQAMINKEWWLITKCSTYIRTFFEEQRKDMHWESFNHFEKFNELNNKLNKELCWKIYRWSATFLAVISFIALTILFIDKYQKIGVSLFEAIALIIGLFFFHIVAYTNTKAFSKSDENITGLKKCIEQYYDYIQHKEKSDL